MSLNLKKNEKNIIKKRELKMTTSKTNLPKGMDILIDVIIKRQYVFSQKTLKEKLGIKGNIKSIQLWEGRNLKDQEEGLSADEDKYSIETAEAKPNSLQD